MLNELPYVDYSFASAMPPVVTAKVASLSGWSGLLVDKVQYISSC